MSLDKTGGPVGVGGAYDYNPETEPESQSGKAAGRDVEALPSDRVSPPTLKSDSVKKQHAYLHPEKKRILDAGLEVVNPSEKNRINPSRSSKTSSDTSTQLHPPPIEHTSFKEVLYPIDDFNPQPLPPTETTDDESAAHESKHRRHSFGDSIYLPDDLTPIQQHSSDRNTDPSKSETASISSAPSLENHFDKKSLRVLKFSMDKGATFWVRHKINSCPSREKFEALRNFIFEQNPKLFKKLKASIDKKDAALSLGLDLKVTQKLFKAIEKSDFKFISKTASKIRQTGAFPYLQELVKAKEPKIYNRLFTPAVNPAHQLVLRGDISAKVKKAYIDGMDAQKVSNPAQVINMTTLYLKAAKEFSGTKGGNSPTPDQREALYQGLVGLGSRFLNLALIHPVSRDAHEPAALQLAKIAYDLHQVKDLMANPNPAMPKGQTDNLIQAGIYRPTEKKLLFEKTLGLKLLSRAAIDNDREQAIDRKRVLEGRLETATQEEKEKLIPRIQSLEDNIKVHDNNLEEINIATDNGMLGQDELFRDCFNNMIKQLENQLKSAHLDFYETAEEKDRQVLLSPSDILSSAESLFKERAESRAKSVPQKDSSEDADAFLRRITDEKLTAIKLGVLAILADLIQKQD